jgi:hypothetical protein
MFHGQKRYLQVLLDPARAELLDRMAKHRDLRTTALAREQLYAAIQQGVPPEEYQAALEQDEQARAEAIARQVQGRKKKKPTVA